MNLSNLWNREPALVVGVVQALLSLLLVFGAPLSTEQVGGILVVTAALLSLLVRRKVSPVAPVLEVPSNVELGQE